MTKREEFLVLFAKAQAAALAWHEEDIQPGASPALKDIETYTKAALKLAHRMRKEEF